MITASLNNYRQSPRKVRLVANLIRGKSIKQVLTMLEFVNKKATDPISVLIESAVANAKNNFNIEADNLFLKEIRVDVGVTLKRRMPRARGMAFPINKRTSHVHVVLDNKENMKKSKKQVREAKGTLKPTLMNKK